MIAQVSRHAHIRTSFFVLKLLIILTAGYWSFGKAFAYIGIYPLYIGEVAIGLGLLALLRYGTIPVPRNTLFWIFGILLWICLGQSVYSVIILDQPALEVIRGLAVIYYGVFAYITFVVIERSRKPGEFFERMLTDILPRAAPWILLGSTITAVGAIYFHYLLPIFPRTDVPVLWYKPTDAVMPLVVIIVLWMRGYLKSRYAVWAAGLVLFAAARSRSAMLGVGIAFLLMLWRPTKRMLIAMSVGTLVFVLLLVTDVSIDMGYREISARQFMANAISLVSSDQASEIDPTTGNNTSWRLDWWTAIVNDAVDNTRFIVGTGWGDNLANRYGFQIFAETEGVNVLRNPHNALIGILARGGWIVAGLWTLFHVVLISGLWQATRKTACSLVERDVAWVCLIYIVVSLINGSTDVFLESPQNAIPHWVVVGVAWSLIYRQAEPAVEEPAADPEHAVHTQRQRRALSPVQPQPLGRAENP
ncbi:MAG: O-antigen ligase family protein [Chloroflexia bacterium]|nr:O-antigen ligase family protein [Chloroflexia bacterium]